MTRIVIIGSGNVAWNLAATFSSSKSVELSQVIVRREDAAEEFRKTFGVDSDTDMSRLKNADFYIIAVSDSFISEVSRRLVDYIGNSATVCHTSAAESIDAINTSIARRGVFYPLQTFSKGRKVDFKQIPVFVEATNSDDMERIRLLASKVSNNIYEADWDTRKKLHLAAVFVCNFVNAMYGVGETIMDNASLPKEILHPLIDECSSKFTQTGLSASSLQTGPAIRGDIQTMNKHLELIKDSTQLTEVYKMISNLIRENYGKF